MFLLGFSSMLTGVLAPQVNRGGGQGQWLRSSPVVDLHCFLLDTGPFLESFISTKWDIRYPAPPECCLTIPLAMAFSIAIWKYWSGLWMGFVVQWVLSVVGFSWNFALFVGGSRTLQLYIFLNVWGRFLKKLFCCILTLLSCDILNLLGTSEI